LTNLDPSAGISPELATDWTVNDTGTTWTFMLRNDVPWVRLDPVTGDVEVLRTVTAYDVEYGIKRACDPRLEAVSTPLAAKVVLGCDLLALTPTEDVTDADYDQVQVRALDDATLEIDLQYPVAHFRSLTSIWIFRPVPREIVEVSGENWSEPGTIATNGPYLLSEWDPGNRLVLVRNPYLPDDLRGPGNVERVEINAVADASIGFALYQQNQIDSSPVNSAVLADVLANEEYSAELVTKFDLTSVYFGFAYDKAPFDNVHVRRAFSAAVDRERFVNERFPWFALPMIHFTPPGVFGSPPIDQVGVGFDPEYARAQLAQAGYPDCEGFPDINILAFTGSADWFDFLVESAEEQLNCDPDHFHIEEADWPYFFEVITPGLDPKVRPHMWAAFWIPDYADAHNFVGDVLSCEAENAFMRRCAEVDDLIEQAAAETDTAARVALYRDIEEWFFGAEGEFPIIPLFMVTGQMLFKPWVEYSGSLIGAAGGIRFDWITIDQAAQSAARVP
jgi:oligopeptide transport system substrate-binding protein